jgi:hypothetical protein
MTESRRQVMRFGVESGHWRGAPIRGLYAAGTIGPAPAFGYIAARPADAAARRAPLVTKAVECR